MTLQALKNQFLKGSSLLQLLFLAVAVFTFSSCEKDNTDMFFFDAEAQKVKDEAIIRQYFRDNDVDTTVVERTASGLYFLEVTEGEGEQVELGDTVSVHYIGRFTNNSKFDSSYDRGKLFTFVVEEEQVIDGWLEGVQKMRVGGEAFLYIPSHLAYGRYGSQPSVPPNTVLVFDIEVKAKK
ncbi:FKBP-type peptidyl-prolyl cis-trans isomerase [Pontibacter fetidus]|uniref:Peptidyl-prolyl cis-trans isomerase n=1 Tax=Pontibacter fetidus TaxID=2700082 RepID=A0A6B2H9Q3_9BACT|nr:FKBP-type peptidyl-prolyl cis-trans isomerase [Pontibacter fetidus]NDK56054.1 peptidylprolyl isomerase [Pontibacter fetidus]